MIELLIDGYNVIFQCGLQGRVTGSDKLERARRRLLNELAAKLNERERTRTTVVFDAKTRPIKQVPKAIRHHGLHVLFAVDFPDADSQIEELIRTHSAPKKLTVISSDHRIQSAATRRKAKSFDSDIWWDRLESMLKSVDETTKPSTVHGVETPQPTIDSQTQAMLDAISETDLEAWMADQSTGIDTENDDSESKKTERKATSSDDDPPKNADLDDFDPFPPGYADDLFDD